MFTRTIRSQMLLGKSGVRWDASNSPESPTVVSNVKDYITELKKQAGLLESSNPDKSLKILEIATSIESSQVTLGRSLAQIHGSILNPTTYEAAEQQAIRAFTAVGIEQSKSEAYAETFVEIVKNTQFNLAALKQNIDHSDGLDYAEMKNLILDPTNFSQEMDRERFLSFFRGMKKTAVRTSNFGAHQFEQALTQYVKTTDSLRTSMQNITGKNFGTSESENKDLAAEYIRKVNERADFLSRMFALYNGKPQMGGLEAVITGKDSALLTELFTRSDFAEKLKQNGMNEQGIWDYIKHTGITAPLPWINAIGSYETGIDTNRNANGLRADNSQKGELFYAKSNVFGLVDQISGKEPTSFAKVASDVVRTIIRPIEAGVSLDRRERVVENSALIAALSWNAVFDIKSGTVNNNWEKNVEAIITEFQDSNSLPQGFNKEALIASMEKHVQYFDTIKQNGDGAESKNSLILTQLRQAYVDQVTILTASRVDQGSKFDGVSAGLAFLVLPFVKLNTSSLSLNRVGVESATNDVARTAAKVVNQKDKRGNIDRLGFTYTNSSSEHTYSLKDGVNIDLTTVILPDGAKLSDDKKAIISSVPLTLRLSTVSGVDISKGQITKLIVEQAKETTVTVTVPQAKEDTRSLEDERSLTNNLAGSIYVMSRREKEYPAFSKMIQQVADQKYNEALVSLQNMKKSKVAQGIIRSLGGVDKIKANPASLAVILSYTYGSLAKDETGDMNKKSYIKNRKGTHEAEVRLARDRANEANENEFNKMEKHVPKLLSDIYGKDRAISVSVYATPRGGKHRIDKIDGSIMVSSNVLNLTNAQKEAVIREHTLAIEAGLARLNKILPQDKKMDTTTYANILKTGAIPANFTGLKTEESAKFFEARALIKGNRCANKVEGMVLPIFSFENTKEEKVATPEYTIENVFEGDRAEVDGTTIGLGAMKGVSHDGSSQSGGTETQPGQIEKPIPGLPNTPPATGSIGNAGSQTVGGGFVPPKP